MAKRAAANELNHDNWNDEETPEEAGTFAKASAEVLEKRILKTAKRRVTNAGEAGKSAFSSFAGFKTAGNTGAPAPSPFSFLTNINSSTSPAKPPSTTNGSPSTENGTLALEAKPTSNVFSKEPAMKNAPEKAMPKSPKKSSSYYSRLKSLNEGVSQWIKKHVDASPYCILTPIFRDYEKYLKDIEALNPEESKETPSETLTRKSPVKTEPPAKAAESSTKTSSSSAELWKTDKSPFLNSGGAAKSIFKSPEPSKTENLFSSADSESNPFFKKTNSTEESSKVETKTSMIFSVNAVNPATFSFGQSSVGTASAGFSFGSGKPFTFGAQVAKPAAEEKKEEEEDKNDEDEPPKPDFKPITEEGSIYEQRCKVYIKKDGQFGDRGVGTLFLKPTPNNKMQLIVRAVNSLGNLLLNTLLTSSMPIKRMKDNTIMLICLPLPDSLPPPTSVLLRVKNKEDGDALLDALEKHAN